MHKLLKSLLKTAVYVMDQSSDQVERFSDRVTDLSDRGKKAIYREQDHTLNAVLCFAAGAGLGIAAGILFAPASGKETRDSISDKVQDIGDKVRERFTTDTPFRPTGTDVT